MILDIITTITHAKSGAKFKKRTLSLECDVCHITFERRYSLYVSEMQYHLCSRKCKHKSQKPGGIINKKIRATNKERLGVDYPGQSIDVKAKARKTYVKIYGVDHPLKNKEVINQIQETNIKKYGQKYASMCLAQKEKAAKTCLEKYGTISPTQNNKIKSKQVESYRKSLGVDYPMQSADVRKKSVKTSLAIYGTRHPAQSDVVLNKIKNTVLERYGVECYFQTMENRARCNSKEACAKRHQTMLQENRYAIAQAKARQTMIVTNGYSRRAKKIHETMKRNGTYKKSKSEDAFYEFLCYCFRTEHVERQVLINGWTIDFKVDDVYIQFDGVYWHGLDRDINEIKMFKNKRDKTIYETYLRDKKQNVWFEKNKIPLIRITDKQFL